MKKQSTIKKLTAVFLAILTLLSVACSSSIACAATAKGGAAVFSSGGVEHFEDPADAWSKFASLKENASFQLCEDWIADENGSFGTGKGFSDGAILLSYRPYKMIIDLNGFTVDRGLKEKKEDGSVFIFKGCVNAEIRSSEGIGRIKGGNSDYNGGAIMVRGSALTISNVEMTGNKAVKGGALYITEGNSVNSITTSTVTLYDCKLTENKANVGGAVFLEVANTIKIFDTTITNNYAKKDAGVHTEVSGILSTHIYLAGKVIIADNIAEERGTGLTLDENFLRKVSVSYESARPLAKGSRIVVFSPTGDKTLRITADSSEYFLDCYEYENDSYSIITQGSADSKYLAIKKN